MAAPYRRAWWCSAASALTTSRWRQLFHRLPERIKAGANVKPTSERSEAIHSASGAKLRMAMVRFASRSLQLSLPAQFDTTAPAVQPKVQERRVCMRNVTNRDTSTRTPGSGRGASTDQDPPSLPQPSTRQPRRQPRLTGQQPGLPGPPGPRGGATNPDPPSAPLRATQQQTRQPRLTGQLAGSPDTPRPRLMGDERQVDRGPSSNRNPATHPLGGRAPTTASTTPEGSGGVGQPRDKRSAFAIASQTLTPSAYLGLPTIDQNTGTAIPRPPQRRLPIQMAAQAPASRGAAQPPGLHSPHQQQLVAAAVPPLARASIPQQRGSAMDAPGNAATARPADASSRANEQASHLQAQCAELDRKYSTFMDAEVMPLLQQDHSDEQRDRVGQGLEELSNEIAALLRKPNLSDQNKELLRGLLHADIPRAKEFLGLADAPSGLSHDQRGNVADLSQAHVVDNSRARPAQLARTSPVHLDQAILEGADQANRDLAAFKNSCAEFGGRFDRGLPTDFDELHHLGGESERLLATARAIKADIHAFLEEGNERTQKLNSIEVTSNLIAVRQQQIAAEISKHQVWR